MSVSSTGCDLARQSTGDLTVVPFHERIAKAAAWYRDDMARESARPDRSPGMGA